MMGLTCEALASVPMTHTTDEPFAPPMATNWWAEVQACHDPIAYRFFTAPPLATAEGLHAELYLRLPERDQVVPLHALGAPVTHQWYPDRVVRWMEHDGLRFSSLMTLAPDRDVLLLEIVVENLRPTARSGLRLFLKLLSGVQRLVDFSSWNTVALPVAATRVDADRNAFVFVGEGPACSVQGTDRPSRSYRSSVAYAEWLGDANLNGIVSNRVRSPSVVAGLEYEVDLAPGERWRLRYVNALAEREETALAWYDETHRSFDDVVRAARRAWERELAAAFTPGNDRFSGHLPTVEGVHAAVERVYLTGALNLLFMKRTGHRN